MKKIIRIVDSISHFFGIIAGLIMLLGVLLVLTEIVLRSIFNSTLYITSEYSGYFMAAITFLGLSYTLKENGHIRMEILYKLVKGKKLRLIVDIYALIVGAIVFIIITFTTFNYFWDSVLSGTQSMQISKTYIAVPQAVMPLGSLMITLQFINELLKSIINIRTDEVEKEESEPQALGR